MHIRCLCQPSQLFGGWWKNPRPLQQSQFYSKREKVCMSDANIPYHPSIWDWQRHCELWAQHQWCCFLLWVFWFCSPTWDETWLMIKKFNSGVQISVCICISIYYTTNVVSTVCGAYRAVQLTEWALLAGWLASQICHAIPENGFNSALLQFHYYIEIPAILCIDDTTEGGKTWIRNRNSCSHGCRIRKGKLCQGCVPLCPTFLCYRGSSFSKISCAI